MVDNQIDRQAEARANLGLDRLLQQPRYNEVPLHPSRGGSQGYSVSQRQDELTAADAGLPTRASIRSHHRWRQDIMPRRMTGNKDKEALVGRDQFLLCYILFVYPEVSADQIGVFIINNGGDVYERSQISIRMSKCRYSMWICEYGDR
jgi:hypothetical protein